MRAYRLSLYCRQNVCSIEKGAVVTGIVQTQHSKPDYTHSMSQSSRQIALTVIEFLRGDEYPVFMVTTALTPIPYS